MARIAVLGGSGFIGTKLVECLLAAGDQVVIGDLRKSDRYPELWRPCDVTVASSLVDVLQGADAVVNLAAEHRDDVRPVERYYAVNVDGARHTVAVAAELGIDQILFTSSVAVYGVPRGVAREDHPCEPFNEYGRTKLLAEAVYREWWSNDTTRSLTIVRPTVVFGEGNRGNVYNLLTQIRSGRFLMVGSGRNRKSLAYVGNVAAFLSHSLRTGGGFQLFNYSDSPDFDMLTLTSEAARRMKRPHSQIKVPYAAGYALGAALDLAGRVTGKTFPLSAIRVKKFCANTQISAERALATGFTPTVPLTDALARVIHSDFPD